MAKIDEAKEYLTTLRVFFTVSIAIMVRHLLFVIGMNSEFILMVSVIFIIKKSPRSNKSNNDTNSNTFSIITLPYLALEG